MADQAHRVVIVGGGFGGLYCARKLRSAKVDVTLIDRRNFHLFQPLLYQVATGALSPANIAAPLRGILRYQRNTRVLLAEAADVDVAGKKVILTDGELPYDTLVVAAGAKHAYFGKPEWEKLAPGLKTVEDATDIRRRVLWAFEMAERCTGEARRRAWMTFAVVGAGPTGVEMAGAISELALHTLKRNFRTIDPAAVRVVLLEGGGRVLPTYHETLSVKALRQLERMKVDVRLNTLVTNIQPHRVTVKHGGTTEDLGASTVIWAAGVQASPLAATLARQTGAELDRAGRIAVGPDLTLPGHPEVFVIGDMALAKDKDGKPLPGVAPTAMQQGDYTARAIRARLKGQEVGPFRYWDKGAMATIGRAAAVAETDMFGFPIRISGLMAWMGWLFIHIVYLIQFENQLLVLWQWFWNYVTRNRSARLITGEEAAEGLKAGVREVDDAPPPPDSASPLPKVTPLTPAAPPG